MELTTLLTFAAVSALLVMSPGPNGALILKTVPSAGRRAGFANVLGFVTGFYIHGVMSILGISAILVNSAFAFGLIKYLGAAYLCWIGVQALIDAFKGAKAPVLQATEKRQISLRRAYLEGLLTNALNPKVSMFYLAAFPQFITVGQTEVWQSMSLVVVHSGIAACWFGAMVLAFDRLAHVTRSGAAKRWLKGVTGVVFVGFAAKLATVRSAA